MVSLTIEALSSWEVIAPGSGNILKYFQQLYNDQFGDDGGDNDIRHGVTFTTVIWQKYCKGDKKVSWLW